MKKCLYCSCEISNERVIDFCDNCGKGMFGEKTFNTIVQNMKEAREKGDLCHDTSFVESDDKFGDFNGISP